MKTLLRSSTFAAAAFAAVSALAQPKPALVKDIDQAGRAKYQFTLTRTCHISIACTFDFPAVPTGKLLVVTWFNAFYQGVGAERSSPIFTLFPNDTSGVSLNLQQPPYPSAVEKRALNTPILMYVDAGVAPRVEMNGLEFESTLSSVTVTIVGHYLSVP